MLRETIFVFAAVVVVLSTATQVNHCDGKPYEDSNQVRISDCDFPVCNLKAKTRVTIEQNFTPQREINNLVTSVQANIAGVELPFIGVDGTNACENIYNKDGSKAGCPLKMGETYMYKIDFPILEFYPKISTVVRYALMEGNDQITCFTVPAKIVK